MHDSGFVQRCQGGGELCHEHLQFGITQPSSGIDGLGERGSRCQGRDHGEPAARELLHPQGPRNSGVTQRPQPPKADTQGRAAAPEGVDKPESGKSAFSVAHQQLLGAWRGHAARQSERTGNGGQGGW